jgi:hypothetical protein
MWPWLLVRPAIEGGDFIDRLDGYASAASISARRRTAQHDFAGGLSRLSGMVDDGS